MNRAIDHRISNTVIDRQGPRREALFALLDQHLANMLTLFINHVMHKGDLVRSSNEKPINMIEPQ